MSLTAQQPYNNVVRTALQALAAVIGGTNSLHTNSLDEALALPTAEAATLALRTQQIIAHESGVPNMVDPLGGSYFVERLTLDMEREARNYFDIIDRMGGMVEAIEEGFPQREIAEASYRFQQAVESAREDHRRRQRLRAGRRAADPDPLHRRVRPPTGRWRGSVELKKTRDNARFAARSTSSRRPRAATALRQAQGRPEQGRGTATRCIPSWTASAPTPPSARCATRCREVWGEYEEVPLI